MVGIIFIFMSLYELNYAWTNNSEIAAILFVAFGLNAYIAFKCDKI